jgi:uncharacterized protein YdeI (YjbR/CyaY-like superfamily)
METGVIEIESVDAWRDWLARHGADQSDIWVTIFKKASGRQTVGLPELLEEALCWGWVDTQTKGRDELRYVVRFRRRRPGSNWTPGNREILCRLLASGRMQPSGTAVIPPDLMCPP